MNASKERMETVGVRFPLLDIAWLASLQLKDALTPSDKIRSIVTTARRQHEGYGDYEASLSWLSELLAPVVASIRAREFRAEGPGLHSELLTFFIEWLPQTLALVLARSRGTQEGGEGENLESLVQLEAQLAQRCFQLCESLLRLGVGTNAPCYNPKIIHSYLPRIIELAQLISNTCNPKPTP
ncbi:MAG: hypothetical protein FWC28_08415 [Proteobacteria bacterium]|nr:hypothetical protein [Cystobacterineae bacterium]MCL2258519.1 hypothetical protein [Cystobacterineae bacterium]MCL2315252.1 hypothetical protein [Pseudomonadota bacterium]